MLPVGETSLDSVVERALPSGAQSTPISEIMSKEVVCVGPETSSKVLIEIFVQKGISGVPVVDSSGHPIGVVSKTDVLCHSASGGDGATAEHLMTPVTLAMPGHASIARAAAMMSYERVHRVIVVGTSGAVVGLVSAMDVLRWLARNDGYAVP
jgi:CBS domain-containing protein